MPTPMAVPVAAAPAVATPVAVEALCRSSCGAVGVLDRTRVRSAQRLVHHVTDTAEVQRFWECVTEALSC